MAGAAELVFVDYEALESYRAAGVNFVGADAELGAEAVAEAVAESRAAVPEYVA